MAAAKDTETNGFKLNEILESDAFTAGNITLSGTNNDGTGSTIYASGAITTKTNKAFNMILKTDEISVNTSDLWNTLLGDESTLSVTAESGITSALNFSSTISKEYTYLKWNLSHFDETDADAKTDFDRMLEDGLTEDMITPINRYLNFDKIASDTNISPKNLELDCGYKVWISGGDVTVGADKTNDFCKTVSGNTTSTTTIVRGIVIAKGDVSFTSDVTRFEGLIIAGGKIYVSGNLKNIVASPEICRAIIKECMTVSTTGNTERETVRSIFKQYSTDGNICPSCNEPLETDESNVLYCPHKCDNCLVAPCDFNLSADVLLTDVSNIDYPDVCSIDNWTKTVE
jgi:hypothetical protein